ncbi:MAG: glycosyltransferase [Planctomycetes bacterium]|nr:glycosyltransferase [Planctomycetota bacterium]
MTQAATGIISAIGGSRAQWLAKRLATNADTVQPLAWSEVNNALVTQWHRPDAGVPRALCISSSPPLEPEITGHACLDWLQSLDTLSAEIAKRDLWPQVYPLWDHDPEPAHWSGAQRARYHLWCREFAWQQFYAAFASGSWVFPQRPLRSTLRVAAITDAFTHACLAPECDLLQLTVHGWREELDIFRPHLLFVESAWRGIENSWEKRITPPSQELRDLVARCHRLGIPTVFWNKEDPVHFSAFLNTAQLFNWVCTTDIDCIDRYRLSFGHDRIVLFPFACQPWYHNPIEFTPRKNGICFAGSFYVKYHARSKLLIELLQACTQQMPVAIFDRNAQANDERYMFPESLRPYIVGSLNYDDIDLAYKGFWYALSMNTVSQSQTMCARRNFELLASGTIVVSNYARSLPLLLGDTIIATDDAQEALRRLQDLQRDDAARERVRIRGWRRCLRYHTYSERLQALLERLGLPHTTEGQQFPAVIVIGCAAAPCEIQRLVQAYRRQRVPRKRLILWGPPSFAVHVPQDIFYVAGASEVMFVDRLLQDAPDDAWIAVLHASDWYGERYLEDLLLATIYTGLPTITKLTDNAYYNSGTELQGPKGYDRVVKQCWPAASLIRVQAARRQPSFIVQALRARTFLPCPQGALAIHPLDYCAQVATDSAPKLYDSDDAADREEADIGCWRRMRADTQRLPPLSEPAAAAPTTSPDVNTAQAIKLSEALGPPPSPACALSHIEHEYVLSSRLPEDQYIYWYFTDQYTYQVTSLPLLEAKERTLALHLEIGTKLHVQLAVLGFDSTKKKCFGVVLPAWTNHTVHLPPAVETVRFALRIQGPGECTVGTLHFSHRHGLPRIMYCPQVQPRVLMLTHQYPAYDDRSRNVCVHARARAYLAYKIRPDIFVCSKKPSFLLWREFQGVQVTEGSAPALRQLLHDHQYEAIAVHSLWREMWEILLDQPTSCRLTVWLHSAEALALHRRMCHFSDVPPETLRQRQTESLERMRFWRSLLRHMPPNLHLVFVSQHLLSEVEEDLGISIPLERRSIIHNPIDTQLFTYHPKQAEDRARILLIRPFASPKYGNDLAINAILLLAKHPCFSHLRFTIVGDGPLFSLTEPLRDFPNVTLHQRFLRQEEIAALHRQHGVFLVPTRHDTQGVSRDEAMSSGLVPITNRVAAVPEFVDDSCGILVPPEDVQGIAHAILDLYDHPEKFLRLSAAAAARVRRQAASDIIIPQELRLLLPDVEVTAKGVPLCPAIC